MALSESGRVYLWGINGYGQCGHSPTKFESICSPQQIPQLKPIVFSKAVCGPNHSLLLTSDGVLYSFGENTVGQVGNGTVQHQFLPIRIREDLRFKDIVSNKENDMTIAVAKDNRLFIWGLANNRRYMTPKQDTSGQSLFDLYAKNAKNKITFRTVDVNIELKNVEDIKEVMIPSQLKPDFNLNEAKDSLAEDLAYSKSCKRIQTVVKTQQKQTIDSFLDMNQFLKNKTLIDEQMRKTIRLFFVFGIYGSKVIFATNEDKVYAFGHNRDGTLGLGTTGEHILELKLNQTLSGKQLVDISSGYEHCIGLTADGRCYGWGCNKYGQLGIRNIENQSTPQPIEDLNDTKVVQISCGSYHSMALTSEGELFSWGHNTFAQLGDRTYNSREVPTQVLINEKVASISSGINHSLALTLSGKVYIWGVNENGQLGREPERDSRKGRDKAMSNRPKLIPGLEFVVFTKAICGPNHSLLLTIDGYIYIFGDNKCGQIGNGLLVSQTKPFKLNNKIKIRDVCTSFRDDLSIAISTDNQCYVWGLALNENVTRPKPIPESWGNSLFDIYVKLAKNKVTFRAVNTSENVNNYLIRPQINSYVNKVDESLKQIKESLNSVNNQKSINQKNGSIEDFNQFYDLQEVNDNQRDDTFDDFDDLLIGLTIKDKNEAPDTTLSSNSVYNSSGFISIPEPLTGELFLKQLHKSFNNSKTSDLIIRSEDKRIYCHKTILQIRNEKFWDLINNRLSQLTPNTNEILINSDSFQSFHTFIQYLYGIEPEIDIRIIEDLLKMSDFFQETELRDLCAKRADLMKDCLQLSNVCSVYEMAVNNRFKRLEDYCIEFAVENWKTILRSEGFQRMDDSLSKRFMLSIQMRN